MQEGAILIPPRVFVGDRAILELPLPGSALEGFTQLGAAEIPVSPDIDIHRVAVERRPGGSRLVIEFTAFRPGLLDMPDIAIEGEILRGLQIEINSILESGESGSVLSGPSGALAVPGTGLLVYGSIGISILALLFALWALFWGRRHIQKALAAWKRWRLLALMRGIEKNLRKSLSKGAARREILDNLSGEFRVFLSYYSGKNCRAMTAAEFGQTMVLDEFSGYQHGKFLTNFFFRCDSMRFKGGEIGIDETYILLTELRSFLYALGKAKKETP